MKFGYEVDRDRFGQAAILDFLSGKRNAGDYEAERQRISAQRDAQIGQIVADATGSLISQYQGNKAAAKDRAAQEANALLREGEAIAKSEVHGTESDAYKAWQEKAAARLSTEPEDRSWLSKMFKGHSSDDYLNEYRNIFDTEAASIRSTPEQMSSRAQYEQVLDQLRAQEIAVGAPGAAAAMIAGGEEPTQEAVSAAAEAQALQKDYNVYRDFRRAFSDPEDAVAFQQSQRLTPTAADLDAVADSRLQKQIGQEDVLTAARKKRERADNASTFEDLYAGKDLFVSPEAEERARAIYTAEGTLGKGLLKPTEEEALRLESLRAQVESARALAEQRGTKLDPIMAKKYAEVLADRERLKDLRTKLKFGMGAPTDEAEAKYRGQQLAQIEAELERVDKEEMIALGYASRGPNGELLKDGEVDMLNGKPVSYDDWLRGEEVAPPVAAQGGVREPTWWEDYLAGFDLMGGESFKSPAHNPAAEAGRGWVPSTPIYGRR